MTSFEQPQVPQTALPKKELETVESSDNALEGLKMKEKSWWEKTKEGIVNGITSSKFMKILALTTMLGPAANVATAQSAPAGGGVKIENKLAAHEDGPVKKFSDIADIKVIPAGQKMNPAIHKKYMSETSPGVYYFRPQSQKIYEALSGYELSTKEQIENYFTKVCEVHIQSEEHIQGHNSAVDMSDIEGKPGIVMTEEVGEWGSEVLYRLVDDHSKYVLVDIDGVVYDVYAKDNHNDGKFTDCANFYVRKHEAKDVIPPTVVTKDSIVYVDRYVEVPGKTDTVYLEKTKYKVIHDRVVEEVPVYIPVPGGPTIQQPHQQPEPPRQPVKPKPRYTGGGETGNPGSHGYHGGSNEPGNPGDHGYNGGSQEPANPGSQHVNTGGAQEPVNPRGGYSGGGKVKAPTLQTVKNPNLQAPQRERITQRAQNIKMPSRQQSAPPVRNASPTRKAPPAGRGTR
jgi:hypothetical protein